MNDSNPTLRKARKLLKKIAKKLGNKDLRILAQISSDSDHDENYIIYMASIASPRDGVEPITFAAFDKVEFIQKIENFYKEKANEEDLELAFLEGRIIAAKNSIEYNEKLIDRIKNPQPENDEPVEGEIVDEPTKE